MSRVPRQVPPQPAYPLLMNDVKGRPVQWTGTRWVRFSPRPKGSVR